jgi:hypothetical protein
MGRKKVVAWKVRAQPAVFNSFLSDAAVEGALGPERLSLHVAAATAILPVRVTLPQWLLHGKAKTRISLLVQF